MNIPLSAAKPDFQAPNISDYLIRRDYLQKLDWPGIVHVVFPVIMPIVAVVGLIGNILTVVILFHRQMKATTNTILFRVLALSDIAVVFFWTINGISEYYLFQVTEGVSVYLDVVYTKIYILFLYLIYLSRGISIWITIALCLERFVFVCYPHSAHKWCSKKKAKLCIAVVISFFVVFSIQQFLEFKPVAYKCFDRYCYINHFTNVGKAFYKSKVPFWINLMIYNIIPTILLLAFSLPIVQKICILYRKRKCNPGNALGLNKREFHATLVILIIVLLSLLCNLNTPYFIAIYVYDIYNASYTSLAGVFNVIVLLNSSVNFVVYGIVGQRFRKIFIRHSNFILFKASCGSFGNTDDSSAYTISQSRDSSNNTVMKSDDMLYKMKRAKRTKPSSEDQL